MKIDTRKVLWYIRSWERAARLARSKNDDESAVFCETRAAQLKLARDRIIIARG